MHILLINPPYHAVTSLYGLGAQTPLGLLLVGGALLDAGHRVSLIDAEARRLSSEAIAAEAASLEPDVIMTGHAGSTPAHPTVVRVASALKAVLPAVSIVYGGVFPTYHGKDILTAEAAIDIVVRGEGERTSTALARALETGAPLAGVPGLFYRECGQVLVPAARSPAPHRRHPENARGVIRDRNTCRRRHLGRSRINVKAFSGMTGGYCGLAMRVRTCRRRYWFTPLDGNRRHCERREAIQS